MQPNAELVTLARVCNDRENTIALLASKTHASASEWLAEAILQGADLIAAKARLKHGQWLDWLKAHCPSIHYLKANRYMRLAENLSRVKDLTEAGSLREALALCDAPVEPSKEQSKQWPAYMEGIRRWSKLRNFIAAHPIKEWPPEGVECLREDVEPVARELWPERFQ